MANLSERTFKKIFPGFKSGHTKYVEYVKSRFKAGCRWLDAGGGRHIFHDLYDGEQELVDKASYVVVCDADPTSLKAHVSVSNTICCNLSNIPLPSNAIDFCTCAMVVEHLSDPLPCFQELARVLDKGGQLIIHTPNLWSYPTILAIASRMIPFSLRKRLISAFTGRFEEDVFPTHYKCNTAATLARLLNAAGLEVHELHHWNHGPLFRSILPLCLAEAIFLKLTQATFLRQLRGQLLVTAVKSQTL